MHFSMLDWTIFSAFSIFFFTYAIPLTCPSKIKHTGISRSQPAPRLTLLPKTRARIDVLVRDKNSQKWSHIFWGTRPITTLFLVIATSWGSYSFPFSFRQISHSPPINRIQMLMYVWYPREYELKYQNWNQIKI